MFAKDSLPIYEELCAWSKTMEGEQYVLSSSLWPALKGVEAILVPHPGESPAIANLREVMSTDHFSRRVTLAKSLQSSIAVLMHLLDPR